MTVAPLAWTGWMSMAETERANMFTGIISDIGMVMQVEARGDRRIRISTSYMPASMALGASIACNGVCLTVVDKGGEATGPWFDVDVSAETLDKSTAGSWQADTLLNLERALKVGDELGGHIVSGHVDAVGRIISITPEGLSKRFVFAAPRSIAGFIAPKGSVAIDGASLTVNEVIDTADAVHFGINIIPHTQKWTHFGSAEVGDTVNLEIDTLARYVARLKEVAA
jgi:riboflavin synthase